MMLSLNGRKLDVQGIGMTSQRTRDRLAHALREKGIQHEAVLELIRTTPRHLFVEEALASRAYEDMALPIGYGQTISQPYVVARMTELLLGNKERFTKLLEIGTGSGYQAAILSHVADKVYTVERIEALYRPTRELLRALNYRNVYAYLNDGSGGLKLEAPFDAIIATAAPEVVPPSLLDQLAVHGRLIIPVGQQSTSQTLQVITRLSEDKYHTDTYDAVQFVPLIQQART